jgi:hypothetical protein
MRLSLSWIVLVVFGLLIVVLGVQSKEVYDAFTDKPPEPKKATEGFRDVQTDDIILTSCPAKTASFIDDRGNTVCCEGEIENGKCMGKEVCSLTKDEGRYPTCGRYFAAILEERGRDRCPTSMPSYFENQATGEKGCAQGRRKQDGSGPLPGVKFCKLYTSKRDDEQNIDSCTNQTLLEKTVCFPNSAVPVEKRISRRSNGPAVIECVHRNGICTTDETYDRLMINTNNSNWKTNFIRMEPTTKLGVCSVAKRYYVDKTLSFDDLKFATLTGVQRPPAPPLPPPPPPPTPVLKKIGGEGQRIYVPPNSTVQYGANGKFVTRKVSGWFQATNQFFGRDPIPGIYKSVYQVI